MDATSNKYCPSCEEQQPVVKTASPQPDQCKECGGDVPRFGFGDE